jgi:hypothetical protein
MLNGFHQKKIFEGEQEQQKYFYLVPTPPNPHPVGPNQPSFLKN